MEREREVIIDTYTLLAIAYDEVSRKAYEILENVRDRKIRGLIPVTVVYEYIVHWLRGRIPVLKNIDEVLTYLKTYFKITDLSLDDYVEAAQIKVRGDNILKKSKISGLRNRRLSIVDSTIIALAKRKNAPIITGDKDLEYVAKKENVDVIW